MLGIAKMVLHAVQLRGSLQSDPSGLRQPVEAATDAAANSLNHKHAISAKFPYFRRLIQGDHGPSSCFLVGWSVERVCFLGCLFTSGTDRVRPPVFAFRATQKDESPHKQLLVSSKYSEGVENGLPSPFSQGGTLALLPGKTHKPMDCGAGDSIRHTHTRQPPFAMLYVLGEAVDKRWPDEKAGTSTRITTLVSCVSSDRPDKMGYVPSQRRKQRSEILQSNL